MGSLRMLMIFDYDGTLIDTKERDYQNFIYLLRKHDLRIIDRKVFFEMRYQGRTIADILSVLTNNRVLLQKILKERKITIESPEFTKYDTLFPNTKEALDNIRNRGVRMAIATLRVNKKQFNNSLERFFLNEYFEKVITLTDVKKESNIGEVRSEDLIKYKMREYKVILRELGFDSNNAFVVGDMTLDIIAARMTKIRCIGVTTGYSSKKALLDAGAEKVFSNVHALSKNLHQEIMI